MCLVLFCLTNGIVSQAPSVTTPVLWRLIPRGLASARNFSDNSIWNVFDWAPSFTRLTDASSQARAPTPRRIFSPNCWAHINRITLSFWLAQIQIMRIVLNITVCLYSSWFVWAAQLSDHNHFEQFNDYRFPSPYSLKYCDIKQKYVGSLSHKQRCKVYNDKKMYQNISSLNILNSLMSRQAMIHRFNTDPVQN